ncbi:exodeoxyribonuclease VII small subunit [Fusobacterium necrophorum]|uniref:Exodeoxyribonuclease 7 small subunit n=2 Tax=Fusobacterium necrophorum TaxID=859 RepID=A0AB73BWH4_9FUSO|nr:exodeoxyribonuclease VII small subunit [Fusobacterium necrophorum subsp. funduliforme]AYZ74151.1 exodeoxyribonuclease VII small subunit [Fusobacterium necrophorum]AZW09968.1 exodeoxyribonuclease VII small subunit [Fusobacterium necrophorum subsp. necrophorum]EHO21884.1 exodeoxyribonuclease VII, small subunit [Fusobacterium necrophorum subsp. funduliforme 1_1_36S]KDE63385.1 exodeoxyribonuclease VII small subunit [Fusobacterium necrophorum DJ-1]KDE63416.1 exodeoxyribonuclease VII small subuni
MEFLVKTMKKNSFEANLAEIDMIIAKMESGELSLEDSVKEYEKAMKLLKKSSDLLEAAEGKLYQVMKNQEGELQIEEL